jgi:Mg2+/Co2+ transporter CorB
MASAAGNDASRRRGPSADGGPDEAALYIKSAIAELSQMARRHGHDMLGYLLDMAQMEADDIVRRRRGR